MANPASPKASTCSQGVNRPRFAVTKVAPTETAKALNCAMTWASSFQRRVKDSWIRGMMLRLCWWLLMYDMCRSEWILRIIYLFTGAETSIKSQYRSWHMICVNKHMHVCELLIRAIRMLWTWWPSGWTSKDILDTQNTWAISTNNTSGAMVVEPPIYATSRDDKVMELNRSCSKMFWNLARFPLQQQYLLLHAFSWDLASFHSTSSEGLDLLDLSWCFPLLCCFLGRQFPLARFASRILWKAWFLACGWSSWAFTNCQFLENWIQKPFLQHKII